MDPAALANPEWTQLGNLITNLWLMLGSIIVIGSIYVTAHIFIPSLVASHHLPSIFNILRLPMYASMVFFIVVYFYFLSQAIVESDVIADIYETYWIKGGSIDFLGHTDSGASAVGHD